MPFNYSSFINEISILINEAEDFSETDKVESSAKFRSWRHKTLDFIYQIESKK